MIALLVHLALGIAERVGVVRVLGTPFGGVGSKIVVLLEASHHGV